VYVAHHGAADEDIFDRAQVGVLDLVDDLDVVELDVEVLVDALERATDLYVVLELDRYLVVYERLEEAEKQHCNHCRASKSPTLSEPKQTEGCDVWTRSGLFMRCSSSQC
jgi:hypothetical protein